MGILGPGKKPAFKVAQPTIRIEKVAVPKNATPSTSSSSSRPRLTPRGSQSSMRKAMTPLPARSSKSSASALRTSASPVPRYKSSSPILSGDERSRKRKAASPKVSTPKWDESDEGDDDWDLVTNRKKLRVNTNDIIRDPRRVIRNPRSFAILGQELTHTHGCVNGDTNGKAVDSSHANGATSKSSLPDRSSFKDKTSTEKVTVDLSSIRVAKRNGSTIKNLRFIHAADLASPPTADDDVTVPDNNDIELQYPASRIRERYELVVAKDKIDPAADIVAAVRNIADVYLTEEEADPFVELSNGFLRRFEKAINRGSNDDFKATLADCNAVTKQLMESGAISRNLSKMHSLPPSLTHFILGQVYDRTVAPSIEKVGKYQPGSDYIYGELRPQFITEILMNKTQMKSDSVFVDLGSGVGNVVLQAALEIGCESWGWEYQKSCCELADEQHKEFRARCQLWGVSHGRCHLSSGDFTEDDQVMTVLRRADAVLVNNQVFTSTLNDKLITMFLDLKPGCKIVSLKNFVHEGKGGNLHSANDVAGLILDVKSFTYPEDWVSWTASAGTYVISTRK
ncbi:hypothetical protein MKZ38_004432 [Zalerion maritima]|uniref:Histone-lysine N-methyltransferase, H3 lysine-79 specific n=1 Tax=Zalerion maritima TaxID=339359 RepID=A0AAD5RY54_9PEZI|nr:hypothetical protein MKZ38_004432 [Zalerion maritima]